jgi:hypothetical protein
MFLLGNLCQPLDNLIIECYQMCTPLQIYIKMGFRHLFKIITHIMLIKAFNIHMHISSTLLLGRALFVPFADGLEGAGEDGAGACAVGLAYEAFAFHHVEDGGGATVADAQASLEDGG